MTNPLSTEQVIAALDTVMDPELGRSIVAAGMVKDIRIDGNKVSFTLELTSPACPLRNTLRQGAEEAVRAVPGVTDVSIKLTSRVRSTVSNVELLPKVCNVIAVASGKGGVGKSTVAANLATALAQTGAKTGLLDLDIYGPSAPLLFGITDERPEMDSDQQKLRPIEAHGVKVMSLGLLMDPDQAVIWRGPMVARAVMQLLGDVDWDELDYLVVDLPPGTGDAQLSLAQSVPITGVVIVATAQDAALLIATKALRMFQSMKVPILGIVENMSSFVCPNCETETQIFGREGAVEDAAKRLRIPFLGRVPLNAAIVVDGDRGIPTVASEPNSPQATAFQAIANKVAGQVSVAAILRGDTPTK
ncbi:MAG TPA: Mrp/NBP35 family ATP-binding protein [Armatimonadota bacterium]|nr:Mrp/NBP35 family ATP-binding protein [Armatimonadota bacterium]